MEDAQGWKVKCRELFPNVHAITTSTEILKTSLILSSSITKVREVKKRDNNEEDGETSGAAEVGEGVDPVSGGNNGAVRTLLDKVYLLTRTEINIKDLRKMSPDVKEQLEAGDIFVVQESQSGIRSSQVSLKDDKLYLYIHCLQDKPPPPYSHSLKMSDIVKELDPISTCTFLDLEWTGSTRKRVHIELKWDTSRAEQFVLLCTGERGHSYRNTRLFKKGEPGGYVMGGDYEHNNGKGGDSLLYHPYQEYETSAFAGSVLSRDARFIITTTDREEGEWSYLIGDVVGGLEVVREALNLTDITQATVVDCGIMVPVTDQQTR
ncbi:hypothetical protein Pcinc_034062 [Petrolisthes cinctipes]|uniref:PPIase cyclophilin-type domain-containing protein n=1 Tax=Petrolisthes cinctipes TaxID=88211 RepID=A0AAE1ER39_PETCI|nr:hypothetical protein Pcinc_034062 [Petrolisthes cinctipes]